MKQKLPLKMPDIVIILLFAALTLLSGLYALADTQDASMVVIQGPGGRWVFPLEGERTVRVPGVLGGDTVVRISGSSAWAESSPCANQICVNMGRITAGSWFPMVSCLPNHVMFRIEGTHERGYVDRTTW